MNISVIQIYNPYVFWIQFVIHYMDRIVHYNNSNHSMSEQCPVFKYLWKRTGIRIPTAVKSLFTARVTHI